MPLKVVLIVGKDLRLLEAKVLILRAVGCLVQSAASPTLALSAFAAGDYDLVILSHSLSSEEAIFLTQSIRIVSARVPILTIISGAERYSYSLDAAMDRENQPLRDIGELLIKVAGLPPLPRCKVANQNSASAQTPASPRRVLLCIDDDLNQLLARRMLLEAFGFVVLTSCEPATGLKIFTSGIADAVVLDYSMPSMNGNDVAARMRQIDKTVPLLLLSGCISIPKEESVLFDRLVSKSEPSTVLLTAIREVLVSRPVPSGAAPSSERSRGNLSIA